MAPDHLGRARARGYRADERLTLGLAAAAGAPAARAKRGRTGAERRATVTWRLCGHAGARMPAGARDGCGCGIAPTRLRGWLTSVFQPAVLDAYDSVRGAVSRWRWAPNTLRASGARAGPYAPRGGRKAAVWARRPPTTACVSLKLRRETVDTVRLGARGPARPGRGAHSCSAIAKIHEAVETNPEMNDRGVHRTQRKYVAQRRTRRERAHRVRAKLPKCSNCKTDTGSPPQPTSNSVPVVRERGVYFPYGSAGHITPLPPMRRCSSHLRTPTRVET